MDTAFSESCNEPQATKTVVGINMFVVLTMFCCGLLWCI